MPDVGLNMWADNNKQAAHLVDKPGPGGLKPVEKGHHVAVAGVGVAVQVDLAGRAVVPEHLLYKPNLSKEIIGNLCLASFMKSVKLKDNKKQSDTSCK